MVFYSEDGTVPNLAWLGRSGMHEPSNNASPGSGHNIPR